MEIASWRPDFARATEFGGFPLIFEMGSTDSRAAREKGKIHVVLLVTGTFFKYTLRGKVDRLAVFRNQGSVSTRELGQFSTVITHIMPTQLNLRTDVNFTTAWVVNSLVFKLMT